MDVYVWWPPATKELCTQNIQGTYPLWDSPSMFKQTKRTFFFSQKRQNGYFERSAVLSYYHNRHFVEISLHIPTAIHHSSSASIAPEHRTFWQFILRQGVNSRLILTLHVQICNPVVCEKWFSTSSFSCSFSPLAISSVFFIHDTCNPASTQ